MSRAIHILSAVGALSAAAAGGAHAAALPLDRPDALPAAHASAAPLQGGGKGHGGGGGQHAGGHQGGGQKHGGARQGGGGGGGHKAARASGGGRQQAHGGGSHGRRSETHASGRGRGSGGGERAVRASRSTRRDRVERTTGSATRTTTLARRGAAGARGSERAARLLSGAAALGRGHGLAADAVNVRSENNRVRLLNRRGDVLLDMDGDRYDDIGAWRLRRMGDQRPRGNAPAFCRSGEGHPVWGREWCLDKGFGLGSRAGTLWSRGTIDDVVYLRPDYGVRLDRGGLLGVLGDLVLARLGLQALTMGYDQPLAGMWVAEPQSPRILRVYSGPYPVAEFVDTDYDDRPEILYVVQPL